MARRVDRGRLAGSRKRFGQHFLEPAWADKVVEAIEPRPNDRLLEIGPGRGVLTLRLAPRVRELIAVEIDRDLARRLTPALPPSVTLVTGDILEMDLARLSAGRPLRVAGNLPYNISSPILFALIGAYRQGVPLTDATVMLQREFAERLLAQPGSGDYGVLTILTRRHADARPCLQLPPGAFRPMPRVDSAVVRLTFRPPAIAVRDEALLERIVKSVFTQRRKTVLNALRPLTTGLGLDARQVLGAAGVDDTLRPEALDIAQLARMADVVAARRRGAVL
ncbi:MAG TPA: 16S rRNA (adenine(1518)-N(6)/adenine(1519)-N(6))-dimethyltransferase RsmA [Vicinamibacterales bacterium]|nr:16S rRNA (adenine(1518)-N(6)/adenine(1519)-N(6))-dimethyltransferase RsmA [Vicinamibacterales bacterium]